VRAHRSPVCDALRVFNSTRIAVKLANKHHNNMRTMQHLHNVHKMHACSSCTSAMRRRDGAAHVSSNALDKDTCQLSLRGKVAFVTTNNNILLLTPKCMHFVAHHEQARRDATWSRSSIESHRSPARIELYAHAPP
jgi:hypothetical protein